MEASAAAAVAATRAPPPALTAQAPAAPHANPAALPPRDFLLLQPSRRLVPAPSWSAATAFAELPSAFILIRAACRNALLALGGISCPSCHAVPLHAGRRHSIPHCKWRSAVHLFCVGAHAAVRDSCSGRTTTNA